MGSEKKEKNGQECFFQLSLVFFMPFLTYFFPHNFRTLNVSRLHDEHLRGVSHV